MPGKSMERRLTNMCWSFAIFCLLLIANSRGDRKDGSLEYKFPILLMPGDGGTQLWATLNKPQVPHYFCSQMTKSPFLLWLNPEFFLPYVVDCFNDNMRTVWNATAKRTFNSPGVDVFVKGWGTTDSIEYLSNIKLYQTSYFHNLIEALVSTYGYERNVNIRGAPYDFRHSPTESEDYFEKTRELVQKMYTDNDETAVILLGHSMGSMFAHNFLKKQDQWWRDKYIQAFISTSAPYSGAVMSLVAETSGFNENIDTVKSRWIREFQRSFTSTAYLMPKPPTWRYDDVLVITDNKVYGIDNYDEFFADMDYPTGFEIYKSVTNLTIDTDPPHVHTYCLYSGGVPTAEQLDFRNKTFPDDYPTLVMGDGDGTVNIDSLSLCSDWAMHQHEKVYTTLFTGLDHLGILRSPKFVDAVLGILEQEQKYGF